MRLTSGAILVSICLVACSKKGDDSAGPSATEKPVASASANAASSSSVSGDGTFADKKAKGLKVSFKSGRTRVANVGISGLIVELSDREMTCAGAPSGAFILSFHLPAPPGGVTQALQFGTFVEGSDDNGLAEFFVAKPGEATLRLTAFSKETGGRIKGSFELHRADEKEGLKYDAKGAFDVAVCSTDDTIGKLENVPSFPPEALTRPKLEGTVRGKAFVAKTVLARNDFGELRLTLYEGETTCKTSDEDEKKQRFIFLGDLGVDERHNTSGALHPMAVGQVGLNSFNHGYTSSPAGWIKLDKMDWPPKAVSGTLVIASRKSAKPEDAVDLGGRFTATFCP